MTNNEEIEDLCEFGESDFSSEYEDDEEDNIFSTNEQMNLLLENKN